ncbi:MAG: hypothetical protein AB8I08_32605 [Sandaracinaceae bacterium]
MAEAGGQDESLSYLQIQLHPSDPWLEPTELTVERYLQRAHSARRIRNWQLALVGSSSARETSARVLPHCFPDATRDAALV